VEYNNFNIIMDCVQ